MANPFKTFLLNRITNKENIRRLKVEALLPISLLNLNVFPKTLVCQKKKSVPRIAFQVIHVCKPCTLTHYRGKFFRKLFLSRIILDGINNESEIASWRTDLRSANGVNWSERCTESLKNGDSVNANRRKKEGNNNKKDFEDRRQESGQLLRCSASKKHLLAKMGSNP